MSHQTKEDISLALKADISIYSQHDAAFLIVKLKNRIGVKKGGTIQRMLDRMRLFARLLTVLFLALYGNAFAYTTSNINLVDAQSLVFNADSLVDSMTKHLPSGHDLPFAHSNSDLSDECDKNLFDVDDTAEAPLIMAVLSWQLLKNKFPLHLAGVDLQFDSVLLRVPIL